MSQNMSKDIKNDILIAKKNIGGLDFSWHLQFLREQDIITQENPQISFLFQLVTPSDSSNVAMIVFILSP